MKSSGIKRIANQSLKSKGLGLFLGTVIFLFYQSFISKFKSIFSDISWEVCIIILGVFFVLQLPLKYGFTSMYVNKRNSENVHVFDFIKHAVKNFGRAWSITLRLIPKYIVPIICFIISIMIVVVPICSSLDNIKELWNLQPEIGEITYMQPEDVVSEMTIMVDGVEYTEDSLPTETKKTLEAVDKFNLDFIIGFLINVFSVVVVESITIIISLVLMLVAYIMTIILYYKYRYCYINAIMNPLLSSKDVVDKTAEIMNGNKFKSFGLDFSFVLRIILFSIISFVCVNSVIFMPQIVKLFIKAVFSALCLMKYYMSHVVFFEEKC